MSNRFIALDPSSTNTGWAIFQDGGLVAWGNIDTTKVEYSFRYQFIINELIHILQTHGFQEIAIEETRTRWKGRNIAALAVAFMSIKKWAERAKVPMEKYNVATWKASVLGNQHASKEDTKATIRLIYPTLPKTLGEHEYDAIGIGLYHAGILKVEAMGARR